MKPLLFGSHATDGVLKPPHLPTHTSSAALVNQQLLILLGPEETTKGVFLHQGEDPLLGQVEGGRGHIHQVPQGDVFGEVINVDLCSQHNGSSCQSQDCLLTQLVQDGTKGTTLHQKMIEMTNDGLVFFSLTSSEETLVIAQAGRLLSIASLNKQKANCL